MTEKTLERVKESVIKDFNKQFPKEKLYGKVFSIYLLDRYANLLLKLYRKANKQE